MSKDNYVPQITPYLKNFINRWEEIKEKAETQQDRRKDDADNKRRPSKQYQVGDLVLLASHHRSNASQGKTRKFMPKRDGPYVISKVFSPTTFCVSDRDTKAIVGKFHTHDLTPFVSAPGDTVRPVQPHRPRGRPKTDRNRDTVAKPPTGRVGGLEGEYVAPSDGSARDCTSDGYVARSRRARTVRVPARFSQ
ncbi:uncharacterized protein [Choristoneura fumiferana]|uniref:uncharacterized protein n=1 Tax=Choristoneura fumiferana TaxID=7141 RepID=UPI003D155DC8